jgi:hypothetical protein
LQQIENIEHIGRVHGESTEMALINRQWLLAKRPKGNVDNDTFSYHEQTLDPAQLAAGESVIKVLCLSFDPAMRGWMDDVPSYLPPAELGKPMRAIAVGQVIHSANDDLPVGTLVQGMFGWQEYAISKPDDLMPVTVLPQGTPPTMALSIFGGTSLTAYFGLLDIGQPQAGETVVVSGAAGATGSVAAQIARLKGCRVIGIAGGEEKCAWLKNTCGLNDVIDYKHEPVEQRLGELCPQGINIFYDNVGGDILQAALTHIADHGRVVMCGQIANYNAKEPAPGPNNLINVITRRVRMQGFIMIDYLDRVDEAMQAMTEWVMSGKIVYRDDTQHGFENIPATFERLFSGKNLGKQLLVLAEPSTER